MIVKITKITFAILGVFMLTTSCLDNEVGEKEDQASQKIQDYISRNGYTEAQNIGYGIYVKVIEEAEDGAPIPEIGQRILMSYTGKLTNEEVFETTDSTKSNLITYPEIHIYGPKKYIVGNQIFGMDTALRTLPEGSKAEIVIPHQYAFGDYEPVVYNVDIHKVIEDDSTYEAETFAAFRSNNMFVDTLYQGLYYKLPEGGELSDTVVVQRNDSATIQIHAYYAEDYYADHTGRRFYPRSYETEILKYSFGADGYYPLLPAVDSVVKYLNINQTAEITFDSGAESTGNVWGLGQNGWVDPVYNIYIIEAYTPLHYRVKLLGVE